jgi:ketosteroid isomerase-like protein
MNAATPSTVPQQAAMLEAVEQYFIRGDAGRPDTLDLFTDDVQIYFPKFGVTHGKAGFGELAEGLMSSVTAFGHDLPSFEYVVAENTVIVEGLTRGAGRDGRAWRGGETPGGRFCSVFKFRDGLIARMHIYLDPDYTGRDSERFLWGTARTW